MRPLMQPFHEPGLRCMDCGSQLMRAYRREKPVPAGVRADGTLVEDVTQDVECAECGGRAIGAANSSLRENGAV